MSAARAASSRPRMSAHGATISDTTTNLDGMETNSMHGWAQSSQSERRGDPGDGVSDE